MAEFQFATPSLYPESVAEVVKADRVGRRLRKRWIVLILGVVMILAVPILLGVMYARAVYYPTVAEGAMVELNIKEGASVDEVTNLLQNKQLIDQPVFFKLYLRFSGEQSTIQAGKFSIPQRISMSDLSERLGVAMREQAVLRFTEGWRREEMAEYIDTQYANGEISFTGRQFSNLALNPNQILRQKLGNRLPADSSLHGFLFPDTYQIDRDATAEEVLVKMLDNYKSKVSPAILAGFASEGLTEYEALTLAAIVERESYSGDERPVIAEILLSRLRMGEILGTDATLQYALGYSEAEKRWWKQGITLDDLEIDSPYNTRRRSGLPPAPIANPGIEAIMAIAQPAETDYLYYLHDDQGNIYYASSLTEHNSNVAKYLP